MNANFGLQNAKSSLDAFRTGHFGEVVIDLDAQNRAGAMLRMTSVCTYSPEGNVGAQVGSLSDAQISQR
jgi:hypothetical protein